MGVRSDNQGYLKDMEPPQSKTWKSIGAPHTHLWASSFIGNLSLKYRGGANHPFFVTPAVFIYRNPRDILISESYYYSNSSKMTQLSGYFQTMTPEERLCSLIEGDPLISDLSQRLGGYLPWLKYPNVIPVSYEELVGGKGGGNDIEQMLTIWSLQLKLHVPGSPFVFSQQLNGGSDQSATFRKGRLGEHNKELSEQHWSLLSRIEGQYMPKMGYSMERDCPVPFPAHRDLFRHRPLGIKAEKIESKNSDTGKVVGTSILYEDFLGFNLIASEGKIWALDRMAGATDFCDTNKLAELVASGHLLLAETVDSARIAVLSHHLKQRQESLPPRLSMIAPESDDATRIIEEDYFGYNLILHAGQVWAAKMAAGPLDFANAAVVANWLSDEKLLRAATLDGARLAVGRLLDRQAYEAGMSKLGTLLEEQLLALAIRLDSGLEEVTRSSEERLSTTENRLEQRQKSLIQRLEERFFALERSRWRQWLGHKKNNGKL
jgi:hypothetical protein